MNTPLTEKQLTAVYSFLKSVLKEVFPDNLVTDDIIGDQPLSLELTQFDAEIYQQALSDKLRIKVQISDCDSLEDIVELYGRKIYEYLNPAK